MLDYEDIWSDFSPSEKKDLANISTILWPYWLQEYRDMSPWMVTPIGIQIESFEFCFDDLEAAKLKGRVPTDVNGEGRVIVAHGISSPHGQPRDDARLKGWPRTPYEEGKRAYDRGHLIANSIGGIVIGSELNVFRQRRDINQGHSEEGKLYRRMEKYCATHPGVYLFARPIWDGGELIAKYLEYGIISVEDGIWVEVFPNQ